MQEESGSRGGGGNKLFVCNQCLKSFSQVSGLKKHLLIHSGERPFVCGQCHKGFSENSNLRKHLLVHSGERPYACYVCPKRFSQDSHLRGHLRVHTGERPFVCYVCAKAFSQESTLKKHLCVHTGVKAFACELCGKGFSLLADLKRHLRVHTGERPFGCELCDKKFSVKSNLKKHLRSHARAYFRKRPLVAPAVVCNSILDSESSRRTLPLPDAVSDPGGKLPLVGTPEVLASENSKDPRAYFVKHPLVAPEVVCNSILDSESSRSMLPLPDAVSDPGGELSLEGTPEILASENPKDPSSLAVPRSSEENNCGPYEAPDPVPHPVECDGSLDLHR